MKNLIRLLLLFFSFGAALLAASCGSKDSGPQTQTLSGEVLPAGAVTTVTATSGSGQILTAAVSSSGAYTFPNLTAGTYTLTFMPTASYATPVPVSVLLGTGVSVAPTVTALRIADAPSASYTFNNAVVTPISVTGPTNSSVFAVVSLRANPGTAASQQIDILLPKQPKIGAYIADGTTYIANYLGANGPLYCTNCGGTFSSGSATITAVSTAPQRFSGTFSFVASPPNPTNASPTSVTVTNGTFTNVPY